MQRKFKIVLVTIFFLIILAILFQSQIVSVFIYRLVAKKIEKINFPFKESDLLGDVSPLIVGKLTKCGNILSVHEVSHYKSYVSDNKDAKNFCY